MAATGVSVDDKVIAEFNDVKLGRVKAKFIIYKIDNGVIVTESVSLSESFDEFIAMLPPDDCRYAMYDMKFTTNDGRAGNKLAFIAW
jgi:cofilin